MNFPLLRLCQRPTRPTIALLKGGLSLLVFYKIFKTSEIAIDNA